MTSESHRLVFIVVAHRNPEQVARLINRLAGPNVRVLLHVDRASPIYAPLQQMLPNDVELLRRRRARWGSYGFCAVALDGLRAALRSPFDHVMTLSGQDYPIRSFADICAQARALGGRSMMEYERFPVDSWKAQNGGYCRLHHHHVLTSTRLARTFPRIRRDVPGGLWPYGGGSWWALSRPAAELIVRSVDRDRRLERYFRTTLLPEESLFQTLLLNSELAETVVNRLSTFALWERQDLPHPATLTAEHLPLLQTLPHWFARKFDEGANPGVLDALDERLTPAT